MWRDPRSPLNRTGAILLTLSLASGFFTHAYNLFQYPLFITDEGIYVQQAWAVANEGKLSPYTYFYDHAPAGWLVMAAWADLLPGQFQAFGNEINTIRVLMVLLHVASVGFLFGIVRRFAGSNWGAFVAAFIFNLSPLAIYYQRQVLLDNLMVFWLLLAVFLLIRGEGRVMTAMFAGLAFGMAMVTKENAVFFIPALAYLVHRRSMGLRNRRFVMSFWWFTALMPVVGYALFAQLKTELVPSGLNFNLTNNSSDRVSLLYTVWWQLNRAGPEGRNLFVDLMQSAWLFRDRYLLIGGTVAVFLVLALWWRDRRRRTGYLVAALLALGYGFYLARGSVLLDFYVTPMVPVFAMNVGLLYAYLVKKFAASMQGLLTVVLIGAALAMPGGYLLTHNTEGKLVTHDLYHLKLTSYQERQIAFVRANIPPKARMIIDDDIWTALHDREPRYRYAHSHFKASSDPEVRDKLFRSDWRNIDYVVMSNKMRDAMERNNGDGREDWILEAVDQHGERIWALDRGDIHLAIYRIQQ